MKSALFIGLIILFSGCKKAVENAQQDLVIMAMTDGQWGVTSFTQNGNNVTADFTSYKFKYYSNKTVDAIKNGTVEKTGNWDGDAAYVEATQIVGSETRTMRLDKQ